MNNKLLFPPRCCKALTSIAVIALATLSAACSSVPHLVTEYRIDVQQGNVLTQEMVAQLRPGLTKDQVRFILGTPLLTDVFHADRWDYIYRLQKGKTGEVDKHRLTAFFDPSGRLLRVTGDVAAAETANKDTAPEKDRSRVLELSNLPENGESAAGEMSSETKGWLDRMLRSLGF
ncbi:MAG: outer membrane protein assembly factor BamE [Pseudomonadota bacterium]